MNVKRVEFTEEEKSEIRKVQKGTYPAHVHKRILTLKLKAIDGMRSDEIAAIVGIHKTSVNRILARYKREGMEAMVVWRCVTAGWRVVQPCNAYTGCMNDFLNGVTILLQLLACSNGSVHDSVCRRHLFRHFFSSLRLVMHNF